MTCVAAALTKKRLPPGALLPQQDEMSITSPAFSDHHGCKLSLSKDVSAAS